MIRKINDLKKEIRYYKIKKYEVKIWNLSLSNKINNIKRLLYSE
jgi:hypothetical protein